MGRNRYIEWDVIGRKMGRNRTCPDPASLRTARLSGHEIRT